MTTAADLFTQDYQVDEKIKFAFFDLETTGLSANDEVPLELGIKLTDVHGDVIHENSWLVCEPSVHYKSRIAAAKRHHIVGPMHEKSGLWNAIDMVMVSPVLEYCFRSAVDLEVVEWLRDCGAPVKTEDDGDVKGFDGLGMAGNSIGSLDRPFVLIHFPLLNAFLGYRNIDLSSFKEMVKRTNGELYKALKPIIGDKSLADHRTLGDIDACIREFKAYCEEFFITGDEF